MDMTLVTTLITPVNMTESYYRPMESDIQPNTIDPIANPPTYMALSIITSRLKANRGNLTR